LAGIEKKVYEKTGYFDCADIPALGLYLFHGGATICVGYPYSDSNALFSDQDICFFQYAGGNPY